MPLLASPLRNRLALGFTSGMVFVGVTGACFWVGSLDKTRQANRQATEVGQLAESSSAGLDRANPSTWRAEPAGAGLSTPPREDTSKRVNRPASRPDRRAVLPHKSTMSWKTATNRVYSQPSSS